jgi:hypothetical protein
MIKRRPVINFVDGNSTGINKIPNDSIVFVEDQSMSYSFRDANGLNSSSTIQDAIDNGNLITEPGKRIISFNGPSDETNPPEVIPINVTAFCYLNNNGSDTLYGNEEGKKYNLKLQLPHPQNNKVIINIIDANACSQNLPVKLLRPNNCTINGKDSDIFLDINGFDIVLVWDNNNNNWSIGGAG